VGPGLTIAARAATVALGADATTAGGAWGGRSGGNRSGRPKRKMPARCGSGTFGSDEGWCGMIYGPLVTVLVLAVLIAVSVPLLRRIASLSRSIEPGRRDPPARAPRKLSLYRARASLRGKLPGATRPVTQPARRPARRERARMLDRIAPLDAGELIDTALRRRGCREFSDWTFAMALQRLLRSLRAEAQLSMFGQLATRFDALRCLNNQLDLDLAEQFDASIVRRNLVRPIFITGLPRCGSTFLHSMLALDPAVAAPRSWQLLYPYPTRSPLTGADNRRTRVARQFAFFRLLSPELTGMHPLEADAPQECTDITAQVFQSLRFDTIYRIPAYRDWLDQHGHDGAYRFHRRFLQHLDAQGASARHWVLKSPDHVFALDALRRTYPDAIIVMLHRDPLCVLASVAKLTEILRRPFTRHLDRQQIGAEISERWADGADRMVAARSSDAQILHLHYHDLVSAPMDTISALYDHCGLRLSAAAEARMAQSLRTRPRGGYAVHAHRLESFGLEATVLRERFAGYMRTFEVRPERTGSGSANALASGTA